MIRLFDTHNVRTQLELKGLWEFATVENKNNLPGKYTHKLFVPGCWETHPEFINYRGMGAFKKDIFIKEDTNLRFVFKGISHTADVYFDGEHISHHYNAFTEFESILSEVQKGKHELIVIADNSFSEDSSLHVPNDYYAYGGIIRPVVLQNIDHVFINNIKFTPYKKRNKWYAEIDVAVKNISSESHNFKVEATLNTSGIESNEFKKEYTIDSMGTLSIKSTVSFDNINEWSSTEPNLYLLQALLYVDCCNTPSDDYIDRIGFREVSVIDGTLLVNNKEVFVQGFNRHEDHAICGVSFPVELMIKDIELMRDMGSNAVRTSHYPNDERFLDLCDEYGLMVWEENHARGLSLEDMQNPNFEKQCKDCIDEMMNAHYNHPSIIIWGILNECASNTPEGRGMYKNQINQIKSLDSSRLVTFASCYPFTDLCLDLVDIVSYNLYYNWYGEARGTSDVEKTYLELLNWIEKNGGKGKPVILSEFGGGAIYGFRNPGRPFWSEERQYDILDETLSVYLNRPEIVGAFIWQYADCRVTEEKWAMKRPRTMNNKGIVDEYRRPKLAYEVVQKHFRSKKIQ